MQETARLVIDPQNDILNKEGRRASLGVWKYAEEHDIVLHIAKAIELAEQKGIPIILINLLLRHGCPSIPNQGRFKKYKQSPAFEEGTWGSELVSELKLKPRAATVTKRRWSAFYDTDLNMLLKGRGISTLIVCGVSASSCVNATVVDAIDRDYDIIALKDCIAGPSEEIVASVFNLWSLWGVKIANVSEVFNG